MNKKNLTRKDQESAENMPEHVVDVPEDRFQAKQQIQTSQSAQDTKAPSDGFSTKKVSHPGQVVKQDAVARVLKEAAGGEVTSGGIAPVSLGYDGGNVGTIADNASHTPLASQGRSSSRYGKKLDPIINKINYVPSENVIVERDESAPIAESHDTQGYNGTYRNVNARATKTNGQVPAATMFQRSLDEISRDQLYFTAGQVVKHDGVEYADTPTLSAAVQNGIYSYPDEKSPNYTLKRGNFLPRSLHLKFSAGKLADMKFTVDDVSTTTADNDVANASSSAELRHINRRELDRQKMDAKAGDEKGDIWTPLARAVRQPSQTVAYLSDLEADTGDSVWFAYKKTALALSYQLNRTVKDGLNVVGPRNEALLGCIYSASQSEAFNADGLNPFSVDAYKNGAASLMLAAFDSTDKYKTKADILMFPKTFKSYMQTADNNMNPLRCHSEFIKCVNNREVFSTIDREYDPLLPVCISDKESLIYPYDWSKLLQVEDGSITTSPFRYMYHDLRNVYTVTTAHPLLYGLYDYLRENASAFFTACQAKKGGTDDVEIDIPVVYSTRYFSTWALMLLAATPYIIRERINTMRDVLYYEQNVEYPFSGLVKIADANPMNAVNYSNPDYQQPIIVGRMMNSTALTWTMPEVFWAVEEPLSTNDAYRVVAPWYFSQEEYDYSKDGITRKAGAHAITMPSIRSGIRLAPADILYSMTERDVRLCLDRITALPVPSDTGAAKQGVYKYDQMSDGIPFMTFNQDKMNYKSFIALPRELGYFMVAPFGVLTPKMAFGTDAINLKTVPSFIEDEVNVAGLSSYAAKSWYGDVTGFTLDKYGKGKILKVDDINVNRSTAFIQKWVTVDCGSLTSESDRLSLGYHLSLGDMFDTERQLVDNESVFIPFTDGVNVSVGGGETQLTDGDLKVVSLQKALWTRIQLLPFAISPWDACSNVRVTGQDGVHVDPFDMCYAFGFCGFRASDYAEDVYNRDNMIVNQGSLFISDPWVEASPIFKESTQLTQV